MGKSTIEWTDETWNPVAGCKIVSPGCTNCYAMRMAARLEAMSVPKYEGLTRKSGGRIVWTGEIRCVESELRRPLTWKKSRKVFVNSMSDLFHDDVPPEFIAKVWQTMKKANKHQFQILTKRPDRMRDVLEQINAPLLPNVWLGTSVENDEYKHRIDELREIPAAVRFISFEPLLGEVKFPNLEGIHWAIIGGESGPKSRPMEKEWVEELQDSCEVYDTAFFFKQWGGVNKKKTGRRLNGRTYDGYPQVTAV